VKAALFLTEPDGGLALYIAKAA